MMYILFVDSIEELRNKSELYDTWMNPLLEKFSEYYWSGNIPAYIKEIPEYLHVCKLPFRKLEYSFALDILIDVLKPGDIYLDAGCGATPLAYVQAKRGVNSFACDGNEHLINNLKEHHLDRLFEGYVDYSFQDITKTSYPDNKFDAISCISVLEHIPAPFDKNAILELLRILKPGGYLILTVDFTPTNDHPGHSRLKYYFERAYNLARNLEFDEVINGVRRKLLAQRVVVQGDAKHPRSANQCFEVCHLEEDILSLLYGKEIESRLAFPRDPNSIRSIDAKQFWGLEGKENADYERDVLPVGLIIQKPIK